MYITRYLLFITITLSCLSNPVKAQQHYEKMEKQVFALINEYRKDKGLNELEYMDDAADVAYGHTRNMADGTTPFGHDGFEDRYKTLRKTHPDIHAFAENVAYGDIDAEGAVNMWLHSTGHRKNIEGNYTHTGVGIYRAKNGAYYFTQVFAR